jgi:uncharacterized protein YjiS (DUF1127 family)
MAFNGAEASPFMRGTNERRSEKRTTMNLIRNYRSWRRYRDTMNELSRLSQRELNDLGINRGDIPAVAARAR